MFEVFGHRVSGLGVRCFCLRLGFGGAEFAVIGKQGGSTQYASLRCENTCWLRGVLRPPAICSQHAKASFSDFSESPTTLDVGGALYGISLSLFLLMCFLRAL